MKTSTLTKRGKTFTLPIAGPEYAVALDGLNHWSLYNYKNINPKYNILERLQNKEFAVESIIELNRFRTLYSKYPDFFIAPLKKAEKEYWDLYSVFKRLLPVGTRSDVGVSEDDECLFRYYSFGDNHIYAHMFFEDEISVLINLNVDGKMISLQGDFNHLKSDIFRLFRK